MKRTGSIVSAAALWLSGAGAAETDRWTVSQEASEIRFTYTIDDKPAEGRFTRFSGEGAFDPDRPGAAEMVLRIESASIDLGNALVNAYATSAEWFDSRNHPHVTYRLIDLEPLGGDRYRALGEIDLLGREQALDTEMTLATAPGGAEARGTLSVDRRDFGLGVGLTDLFVEIGDTVSVRFDLVARPAGE